MNGTTGKLGNVLRHVEEVKELKPESIMYRQLMEAMNVKDCPQLLKAATLENARVKSNLFSTIFLVQDLLLLSNALINRNVYLPVCFS